METSATESDRFGRATAKRGRGPPEGRGLTRGTLASAATVTATSLASSAALAGWLVVSLVTAAISEPARINARMCTCR